MTLENNWVADGIYGIDITVNGNCWGAEDTDNINGSRVSFKVGSWRGSSIKI